MLRDAPARWWPTSQHGTCGTSRCQSPSLGRLPPAACLLRPLVACGPRAGARPRHQLRRRNRWIPPCHCRGPCRLSQLYQSQGARRCLCRPCQRRISCSSLPRFAAGCRCQLDCTACCRLHQRRSPGLHLGHCLSCRCLGRRPRCRRRRRRRPRRRPCPPKAFCRQQARCRSASSWASRRAAWAGHRPCPRGLPHHRGSRTESRRRRRYAAMPCPSAALASADAALQRAPPGPTTVWPLARSCRRPLRRGRNRSAAPRCPDLPRAHQRQKLCSRRCRGR